MARGGLRLALRWLEGALFVGALACVTWLGVTWSHATLYQLYAKNEMDRVAAPGPPAVGMPAAPPWKQDSLIGVLAIPNVSLSVAVVEGDDDQALRIAVGHLPDTPLPWEEGNSALAGHRDTFFRALEQVRGGDDVSLATRHGTLRYRVKSVAVVSPDDVAVLGSSTSANLTLITCYPFQYVGPAPRRFVVQAQRIALP